MIEIELIRGSEPMPELPPGWTVERSAHGSAVAISPSGKLYLAGLQGLHPCVRLIAGGYQIDGDGREFVAYEGMT
jgi:hypothetical protein